MNILDVLLTSLSMSIDAMSVNVANGVREKNIKTLKIILISLSFGFFQFIMPVIGYFIGSTFKEYIEVAIPWVAFGLLAILSIKSLIDWIKERKETEKVEEKKISFGDVMLQSIATSIDALCIGFVYMSYSIPDALLAFGIIGVVTFTLSFATGFFSKYLAGKLNKWAGLIAAVVFLGVGLKILLEGILK